MALFKIFKGSGTFTDLNKKRPLTVEGYCYFTPQDGKFYIDIVDDNNIDNNPGLDPGKRIVLNAGHADYASFYANGKVGDESKPIYINSLGQPVECGNILNVSISQGLTDETGKSITVGSNQLPVYFSEGRPVACNTTLGVNISGNAATADLALEANHATESDEAIISHGTHYLLNQNNDSLTAGGLNKSIYFVNGVPAECNQFLPLSAGKDYIINGPLGLTLGKNYGNSFPSTGNEFEGQLFFIEDNEDYYYLPEGGIQNQILVKNSNKNGDASWISLDNKFLPSGGSQGQVLIKNSDNYGDASWTTLSSSYLPLSGGTLSGPLSGTYYRTTNYGTEDPDSSTLGWNENGALYFKIIS